MLIPLGFLAGMAATAVACGMTAAFLAPIAAVAAVVRAHRVYLKAACERCGAAIDIDERLCDPCDEKETEELFYSGCFDEMPGDSDEEPFCLL